MNIHRIPFNGFYMGHTDQKGLIAIPGPLREDGPSCAVALKKLTRSRNRIEFGFVTNVIIKQFCVCEITGALMIQKDSLMNDGWLLTIDENCTTGKINRIVYLYF